MYGEEYLLCYTGSIPDFFKLLNVLEIVSACTGIYLNSIVYNSRNCTTGKDILIKQQLESYRNRLNYSVFFLFSDTPRT